MLGLNLTAKDGSALERSDVLGFFGLWGRSGQEHDMSKTNTPPRHVWLRYPEAAEYLGCTTRQLQRWIVQRRIDHTRLGNATLFSPEQLDAFVAANTHKAAVTS